MVCIYCGGKTEVVNSRLMKRNNQVWRRRRCLSCAALFTTRESLLMNQALSVRQNGKIGPFLPDLLYTEVLLALQDRKDCYTASRELTDTIIGRLLAHLSEPVVTSVEISKTAGEVLKRFNRRAWLRYVAEHPSLQ